MGDDASDPDQPGLPRLSVVRGDITRVQVDAIVNAANNRMRGGGGVNGAIHAAGGPALLADCIKRFPDGLATGDAGWTIAGDLPARWVIHTVGPNHSAGQTDRSLLISSYRRVLEVADGLGATSIAFPLLSAGAFGWPRQDAIAAAVEALASTPTRVTSIQLVAHDEATFEQIGAALARWTPRRILEGVQVLHERGFQGIRILPGMSPSGMYWRVSIAERSNFEIEHGHLGLRDWDRAINYSTGAGVDFARGSVTPTTSPGEVADLILAELPGVRAVEDEEYVVWYAGLMRLVESSADPTAALPIAYDEYFDDRDSWKVGWGTGRRYPRPPIV